MRLYECSVLHEYKRSTQAKLSTPTTSASGDQSAIAFCLRFLGFRDSSECAVARESVRFCAPTGLVIPPEVVQLAWTVLEDRSATEREVKLARWLLLGKLLGPR